MTFEYPPQPGGAGMIAHENRNIVSELGFNSETLVIRNDGVAGNKNKDPFITEIFVGARIPWMAYFYLVFKIRPATFQAILLNDQSSIFFAGLFFRDRMLSKCICFAHGDEVEQIVGEPSLFKKIVNFKKFYLRTIKHCDLMVFQSEFMKKKWLLGFGGEAALMSKLIVAPTGFRFNGIANDANGRKKIFCTNPENEVLKLLTVSRIVRGKGFDEMVSLFATLHEKGMPVSWTIVGSGDYESAVKEQLSQFGLTRHVTFTGYLPREELPEVYRSHDVFLLLSTFEESFGLVYVEAQVCGLPVIAKRRGALGDIVCDGITGFLVENPNSAADLVLGGAIAGLNKEDIIANGLKHSRSAFFELMKSRLCVE